MADEKREDAEPIELTIIMPCLNEAETLGVCIEKAMRYLSQSGVRGEVLIGDNGSTDGSQEIARSLGARVVDIPVRGYGAACHGAALAARGRFVIMGDSDDSYDFLHLDGFVAKLREGFDLVMGNRFAGGIMPGAMPFKNRYIGNPVLTFVGRLFFSAGVRDFHCGLRGFTRDALVRMDLQTTGMEFASEMVIKAHLMGMRITEIPTTLSKDGRSRPPHLRPWRDGWRHLRFMLLYSPRWLFLYPGLLLILVGTLGSAWLLPGPRRVGAVELDVHSLALLLAMVLVGFQAVVFAALSRIYGAESGFLPRGEKYQAMFRVFTLERGLVVGATALLAGIGLTVAALGQWADAGLGTLDPSRTLRWVLPAATLSVLGSQTVLASFFFSLLGVGTRMRASGSR